MKALSIKQPWAWAIMDGYKPVENRDWPTRFRGTVAIHASKGMTKPEYDDFYMFIREEPVGFYVIEKLPQYEQLERGVILGTVDIVDCVKDHPSPWFVGEYGFVMASPRSLPTPIPCRGLLGLWDVPTEFEQQLWRLTKP